MEFCRVVTDIYKKNSTLSLFLQQDRNSKDTFSNIFVSSTFHAATIKTMKSILLFLRMLLVVSGSGPHGTGRHGNVNFIVINLPQNMVSVQRSKGLAVNMFLKNNKC